MRSAKFPLYILILLNTFLVYLIFGDVLLHPDQYLFGNIEDGIKNYYTAAYYIKYDSGVWFTGMNYPFGEHITFTDNQPFFAFLLNYIHSRITPVAANIVGIYNLFMLVSIVICAVFIFLILRREKLPLWYAIFIAIVISLLSPQLFRIRNHYALGYSFIIPMCWYLLINIFQQPRKVKWLIAYSFILLAVTFIHPYYILLNLLFFLAYLLVYYLQEKRRLEFSFPLILKLVVAAFIPLLVFQVYLYFTDPVTDRPESPYGFTAYRSSFKTIFLPLEAPLYPYFQKLFRLKDSIWEGYAYVGQTAFLVLILTLIKFIRYGIRRNWEKIFRPVLPRHLRIGLWASVLVLLFALAIPIKWKLEGILDIIPPLKQFRSIGRFAWIFYYVFSVYTAFYLYQLFCYYRRKKKPFLILLSGSILLSFWAFEAINNAYQKAATIKQNKIAASFVEEKGNYSELLGNTPFKATDFQAILPLPFFSIGSEKITLFRSTKASNEAMKASLNTGLPLLATMLSRTSFSQTAMHHQLFGNTLLPKEILSYLPNQKPFLVILVKADTLLQQEAALLNYGRLFFENKEIALYTLSPKRLESDRSKVATEFKTLQKALNNKGNIYSSTDLSQFYYTPFAEGNSANALFGRSNHFQQKEFVTLFAGTLPPVNDTMHYEISAWIETTVAKDLPTLIITESDYQNGLSFQTEIRADNTFDFYKNWLRLSYSFQPTNNKNTITIKIRNKGLIVDEFLIRPVNADFYVYDAQTQKLLKNNYPIF